jgi:TolB-like protein
MVASRKAPQFLHYESHFIQMSGITTSGFTTESCSADEIRRGVDLILESNGFRGRDRISLLLRYLIEMTLAGHGARLTERLIGIEALGRDPSSFDPHVDSLVRVEMSRLRSLLAKYHESAECGAGSVLIEFPRGTYTPTFHRLRPATLAEGTVNQLPPARNRIGLPRKLGWLAMPAIIVVLCCTVAFYRRNSSSGPAERPLSVIALVEFECLTPEAANQAFTKGLFHKVNTEVSKARGLKSLVYTAYPAFSLPDMERQYNGGAMLTGRFKVVGDDVRLNVELIRMADRDHIWSEGYDYRLDSPLPEQTRIAKDIARHIDREFLRTPTWTQR